MGLIEVEEKARVLEEQARIQQSESDARVEEVLEWKHNVSFNRLGTDYCIVLYYNGKLKWACFLVFIFYFFLSLYTRLPSPFNTYKRCHFGPLLAVRHIGFFNARLRNTRLSTRKKSLFLSWTLKKIVQTKLKWKLDKTECIEQCKGINHACGLY